ncbi:MAG: glycoside hydrolase family 55 protein [Pelosinus sp.]|nr:glycoside hydrolase family 55 protein [Pelosinus sp.]
MALMREPCVLKETLCIDAKDYSAVGDGITDDTKALQTALDVGRVKGLTVIAKGKFLVSSTLSVGCSIDFSEAELIWNASGGVGEIISCCQNLVDIVSFSAADFVKGNLFNASLSSYKNSFVKVMSNCLRIIRNNNGLHPYFKNDTTFVADDGTLTLPFNRDFAHDGKLVINCSITSGNNTITPLSMNGIIYGMKVVGEGIQADSYITSVGTSTVTLNKNVTATHESIGLTFGGITVQHKETLPKIWLRVGKITVPPGKSANAGIYCSRSNTIIEGLTWEDQTLAGNGAYGVIWIQDCSFVTVRDCIGNKAGNNDTGENGYFILAQWVNNLDIYSIKCSWGWSGFSGSYGRNINITDFDLININYHLDCYDISISNGAVWSKGSNTSVDRCISMHGGGLCNVSNVVFHLHRNYTGGTTNVCFTLRSDLGCEFDGTINFSNCGIVLYFPKADNYFFNAIYNYDPGVNVQFPNININGLTVRSAQTLSISPRATYSAGQNTMTVSLASGIYKGITVYDSNLPGGTVVTGISGTTITLSNNFIASATNKIITMQAGYMTNLGTYSANSYTINFLSTDGISANMSVRGPGISLDTTVTRTTATAVDISDSTRASATNAFITMAPIYEITLMRWSCNGGAIDKLLLPSIINFDTIAGDSFVRLYWLNAKDVGLTTPTADSKTVSINFSNINSVISTGYTGDNKADIITIPNSSSCLNKFDYNITNCSLHSYYILSLAKTMIKTANSKPVRLQIQSMSASFSSGSNIIKVNKVYGQVFSGMSVQGDGIPDNTTITNVVGDFVTISNNTTAGGTDIILYFKYIDADHPACITWDNCHIVKGVAQIKGNPDASATAGYLLMSIMNSKIISWSAYTGSTGHETIGSIVSYVKHCRNNIALSSRDMIYAENNFSIINDFTLTEYITQYQGQTLVPEKISALPIADATQRGRLFRVEGGNGVGDGLYICLKNSMDTYSWKQII